MSSHFFPRFLKFDCSSRRFDMLQVLHGACSASDHHDSHCFLMEASWQFLWCFLFFLCKFVFHDTLSLSHSSIARVFKKCVFIFLLVVTSACLSCLAASSHVVCSCGKQALALNHGFHFGLIFCGVGFSFQASHEFCVQFCAA